MVVKVSWPTSFCSKFPQIPIATPNSFCWNHFSLQIASQALEGQVGREDWGTDRERGSGDLINDGAKGALIPSLHIAERF